MRKTMLQLTTAPAARITPFALAALLAKWQEIAAKLEEKFLSRRRQRKAARLFARDEVIVWNLVFDWPLDDDPEAECTPQYVPFVQAEVWIADSKTLSRKRLCPDSIKLNQGGIVLLECQGEELSEVDRLVEYVFNTLRKR